MTTKLINKLIENHGIIESGINLVTRDKIIAEQKNWDDLSQSKYFEYFEYFDCSTHPFWLRLNNGDDNVAINSDRDLNSLGIHLAETYIRDDLDFWTADESLEKAVTNVIEKAEMYSAIIVDKENIKSLLIANAFAIHDNNKPGLSSKHLEALVKEGQIEQTEADAYADEHINTAAMSI